MKLAKVIEVDKDKCRNCHKCISVCPVKFCNDGSGDYVSINDDLCIGCGECLKACPHNARYIVDDFDLLMKAINNKEKIVAVVAPAIAAEFPEDYLNFNGWLKSIGVRAIFDVSFGAELTVKSYLEYINSEKPKTVIAQPCPAIVSYIEIYQPQLLKYLAPADSPMMHTIKMIKHFYSLYGDHKVLIISPCIAKKREFEEVGLGDYNVTIKKIKDYFTKTGINLSQYPQAEFDNDPAERAVLFSTPGGLLRTAQREFPGITNVARKIEGPSTIYHYLSHLKQDIDKGIAPLLVDCLNCEHGCNGGTGTSREKTQDEIEDAVEKRNLKMQSMYRSKNILKSRYLAHRKIKSTVNKYWKKNLYDRKYLNLHNSTYANLIRIPAEKEEKSIFKDMLKENESDILNCGACGYNSCSEMAIAIFNKLNKKENCFHYEKKYVAASINGMLEEMEKFSEGDLTVQLVAHSDDEVSKFYNGFNKALQSLRNLLVSLIELIKATGNAGNQIASSAEQMAAGAQEQSAHTTEVASAVEEMTKTIIETTTNASRASESAKTSGNIAQDGGKVVSETIEGMNKIAEVVTRAAETVKELGSNSDKIGEIIQVIDDIADQTNLLALNAAIEAARAGEQGRGFAVVADEVRKLAERTTKATKEIAAMIKQIQKDTGNAVTSMEKGVEEVNSGKHLAEKAGESLSQIINSTKEVIDNIAQVAAASEEQSSAAEQISKNVESISSVTQQSSAGTTQIARAAEDLNRLTDNLQNLVSRFKIDDRDNKSSYAIRQNGKLVEA